MSCSLWVHVIFLTSTHSLLFSLGAAYNKEKPHRYLCGSLSSDVYLHSVYVQPKYLVYFIS